MRTFTLNAVALATLALVGAAHGQTTELNQVTVTGAGDKLGTGLLMEEDAPKARSSVTKAQLEKTRSSGNPFQALSLLPGINSSSFDATGLFGGNLRVRGFNSDQMGFTINGAPVNDSGSFSVFPQEYVDSENLCSLYVTQGAPDTDAPHIGASGGNVGIQSCAPEDKQRVRIAMSGGQLGYFRGYARVDTGKIGDFKGFVSISDSRVDKWKGPGRADRKHLDAGAEYDLGSTNKLSANLLYNRAVTNNFLGFNQAGWASNGYYADFTATIPQHQTPVAGTKQTDTNPSPAYYGYSLNPFENYLVSAKGSFALNDALHLEVLPYFWYGYGTGGTQQTTLSEIGSGSVVHGGIADINGDGDRLDTAVLVYRGSLTQTYRPGLTTTMTYVVGDHKISGGVWFERARHRVPVFFYVRSISVTIFEIEPEIFHRFATKFFNDAIVNDFCESFVAGPSDCASQARRVGRVFFQRAERDRAQLLRGISFEKMRAAVNRVDRLPPIRFAGVPAHERLVRFAELRDNAGGLVWIKAAARTHFGCRVE